MAKKRFFIFEENQFFAYFRDFYFNIEIFACGNRKKIKF